MRPPCFIYFFDGHIGVSPTVLNFMRVLDRDGYDVNVVATRNPYPAPRDSGTHTAVRYLRRLAELPFGRRVERRLWRTRSIWHSILEVGLFAAQSLATTLRAGRPRQGLAIGIDTNGLIAAWLARCVTGRRYACLSLEIGPWPPGARVASLVRMLERRAYRGAEFVMIQDPERFEALTGHVRYRHPKVLYVPNAPLVDPAPAGSEGATATPAGGDDAFLRRRCSISSARFPRIALQAGIIDEAVYSSELARAFAGIDGWALVLHERLRRDPDEPDLAALARLNASNLFLSLEPVPMEELDAVYRSATIGLVFYRPTDDNHTLMTTASGKLGYYLKHGKPVLALGSPSLSRYVAEHEIGEVLDGPPSPERLRDGLERLMAAYPRYSANALACYHREFDFEKAARPALEALLRMARPAGPAAIDRQPI